MTESRQMQEDSVSKNGESSSMARNFNVPILAFSEGRNEQSRQGPIPAFQDPYQLQQEASQNHNAAPAAVLNQQLNTMAFSQQQQSQEQKPLSRGTSHSNYKEGQPERIFDPKPPSLLTTMPLHSSSGAVLLNQGSSKMVSERQESGLSSGVQNIYQVNLSLNNNGIHAGHLLVEQQANHQNQIYGNNDWRNMQAYKKQRPTSSKNQKKSSSWQNQLNVGLNNNQTIFPGGGRRIVKNRPLSANRKPGKTPSQVASLPKSTFKSPAASSFTNHKKHSLTAVMPPPMQIAGTTAVNHKLAFASSQHSDPRQVPTTAVSINPYNRSMKVTKNHAFSASKTLKNPSGQLFASPQNGKSACRALKTKMPTMTLASREDLYEQNMQTKIQINNLRNENRKINTKLLVLENQLVQKDKLFEDMYKAAFQQPKHSHSNGQMFHNPSLFNPQGAGASQNAQKPISVYAPSTNQVGAGNIVHAQAQQLINSYKRTIRELNKEVEKKDVEIDQIKRSVKMTQINQVVVENETYRIECMRLREQLESALMGMQRLANTAAASGQSAEVAPGHYQQRSAMTEMTVGQTESATETFKRDLTATAPLSEQGPASPNVDSEQMRQDFEQRSAQLQSQITQLQAQLRDTQTGGQGQIDQLQGKLRQADQVLSQARQEYKAQLDQTQSAHQQALRDITTTHQSQIEELKKAQLAKENSLKDELAKEKEAHIEELEKAHKAKENSLKAEFAKEKAQMQVLSEEYDVINAEAEQFEIQRQRYKDLEKETEKLQLLNQKGVSDLRKAEQQSENLVKQLKQKQDANEKVAKMAQERLQMFHEAQQEKEELLEKQKAGEEKLSKQETYIKNLEKDIEYKANNLEAESYKHQKEKDELLAIIKGLQAKVTAAAEQANAQQSLPMGPSSQDAALQGRRRSTKKSAKAPSAVGDESFEREDISDIAQSARNQDVEEDRDDLDFTYDNSVSMPIKDIQAPEVQKPEAQQKAEPTKASEPINVEAPKVVPRQAQADSKPKALPKIQENDKTVFGEAGFALSPKEVSNTNVKDGFVRLRHACQINFIKHDHIENFLFGKEYLPERKLSIKTTRLAAMAKLDMQEKAALDFARYLIDQSATITHSEPDEGSNMVMVDESKSALGMRVMLTIISKIQEMGIDYFNIDKEDKMKLIIGEKLQEPQARNRLLSVLKQNQKAELSLEDLKVVLLSAGLQFARETIDCCFIFLLKKSNNLVQARKSSLIEFINSSADKAHSFTQTGSKFPLETELVYSSDSEDPEGILSEDLPPTQDKAQATMKSEGVILELSAPMTRTKSPNQADLQVLQFKSQPLDEQQKPAAVTKQPQLGADSEDASDDDDFGANDSRSNDQGSIREEIASHKSGSAKNLSIPAQSIPEIEDSINDRDLESSIAKIVTSFPPPANPIKEDIIGEAQATDQKQAAENVSYFDSDELKVKLMKSKSLESRKDEGKDDACKEPSSRASGPISPQYNAEGGGSGAKKRKNKPNVNIDLGLIKGHNAITRSGTAPVNMGLQLQMNQPVKSMPTVEIDNTDDQSQMEKVDIVLQPLKEEKPVPFGINVVREESGDITDKDSIESPEPKRGQNDFNLEPLKPAIAAPRGINVQAVPHSIAGRQSDSEDEEQYSNDDHQEVDQPAGDQPHARQQSIDVATMNTEKSDTNYQADNVEYSDDEEGDAGENADKIGDKMVYESPLPSQKIQDNNHSAYTQMSKNTSIISDSFGQARSQNPSVEKPMIPPLPPMELLQLKTVQKPAGINVGELLTDRSHRNASSMGTKEKGNEHSTPETKQQVTPATAKVRDFQLEKYNDKDSEDYSEVDDDNEGSDGFEKKENFGSPLRLKNAPSAEGPQTTSTEVKKTAELVKSESSEPQEDYEF